MNIVFVVIFEHREYGRNRNNRYSDRFPIDNTIRANRRLYTCIVMVSFGSTGLVPFE